MGFFDRLFGRNQTVEEPAPVAVKKRDPFTGTAGAVVYPGDDGNGRYVIDEAILGQGDRVSWQFLLEDDNLEEVMYNGSDGPVIVVHREMGMCDTNLVFNETVCRAFIGAVAKANERRIDESQPFLDGTLADGSRINIAVPPVSGRFPSISIRKFRRSTITITDIIRGGSSSPDAAAFMWCAIQGFGHAAANVLVVGGTGSGKTTALNAMSQFMPMRHRVVTIEDTRELKISQPNKVQMVTSETVSMNDLLVNALRQRPDRILVGEVRDSAAQTLFTAMNTGHDGCMGTLHANSARECMARITSAPMSVPTAQLVGLDLVYVQSRKTDASGTRRYCAEISEVSGFSGDTARLNQLYVWDEFSGALKATGVPSRFRTKLCQEVGLTSQQFAEALDRRARLLDNLARERANESEFLAAMGEENMRH
jgi:flagellar protein FlaI